MPVANLLAIADIPRSLVRGKPVSAFASSRFNISPTGFYSCQPCGRTSWWRPIPPAA